MGMIVRRVVIEKRERDFNEQTWRERERERRGNGAEQMRENGRWALSYRRERERERGKRGRRGVFYARRDRTEKQKIGRAHV